MHRRKLTIPVLESCLTNQLTIADQLQKALEGAAVADNQWISHKLLTSGRQRNRAGKLSLSEAISIMIFYHFSQFTHFKIYYQYFVLNGKWFKNPPCYDRFIQIIPSLFLPIIIMTHYLSGKQTGFYYVDSTHFSVCKSIRILGHKTFKNLAARGHSSIDWFYGFKLYI